LQTRGPGRVACETPVTAERLFALVWGRPVSRKISRSLDERPGRQSCCSDFLPGRRNHRRWRCRRFSCGVSGSHPVFPNTSGGGATQSGTRCSTGFIGSCSGPGFLTSSPAAECVRRDWLRASPRCHRVSKSRPNVPCTYRNCGSPLPRCRSATGPSRRDLPASLRLPAVGTVPEEVHQRASSARGPAVLPVPWWNFRLAQVLRRAPRSRC